MSATRIADRFDIACPVKGNVPVASFDSAEDAMCAGDECECGMGREIDHGPVRITVWECACGQRIHTYRHEEFDCRKCGRQFNSGGQEVRFHISDSPFPPPEFDPLDAGERWDEDDW